MGEFMVSKDETDIVFSDGYTIKDLLFYDGICYWWVIEGVLRNELIENNLSNYIHSRRIYQLLYSIFGNIISLYGYFFRKIIVIISKINISSRNPDKHAVNNSQVLVYGQPYHWRCVSNGSVASLKNIYYDNILDILNKKKIGVITTYSFPETDIRIMIRYFKKYLEISRTYKYCCQQIFYYWDISIWKKERVAGKYFSNACSKIVENDQFVDFLSKKYSKDGGYVRFLITYYVKYVIPRYVRYERMLSKMVVCNCPSAMIVSNEKSPEGCLWIYIGKYNNIPILSPQHGIFAGDLLGSSYDLTEFSSYFPENILARPIPDVTTVWGTYEYDQLQQCAYPKDALLICGNPNYDSLVNNMQNIYSRNSFCNTYSINPNDRFILWLTQSHSWGIQKTCQYFDEVYCSVASMTGVTLIIKQHPYETPIHDKLITKYVSMHGDVKCKILPKDGDVSEAIYSSDIIVLENSTCGFEALIMDKPLIVLDFSEKPDAGKYVMEGVAIGAFKKGSLKKAIEMSVSDSKDRKTARSQYISRHLYKIDGHASQRCADRLWDLINLR